MLDSLAGKAWVRYAAYAVGFLFFATFAALAELNGLLMQTHLPAAGSYGIGSLSDFGFHKPDAQSAFAVVQTWCGGRSAAATSVFTIAHREILVDCGFALLYPSVAAIWLVKGYGRLKLATVSPGRKQLQGMYRRIAVGALAAVPLLALADIAENFFEWRVVAAYDGCQAQYGATAWFWALWVAAVIKYALGFIVLVGVLVVLLGVLLVPDRRARRVGHAILAARGPLIVVALFAFFVMFDPTGQAGDSIRRWEDHWHEVAPAAVIAVLLGWLSGLEAKRVLATQRANRNAPGFWPLLALALGGVALVVLGLLAQHFWGAGKGLLIPGGLMVALALLSFFIPGVQRQARPMPTGFTANELPSVIAAIPPVALGLAVFRAAFAELAYSNHPQFWWLVLIGIVLQLVGWASYELVRRVGSNLIVLLALGLVAGFVAVAVLIDVVRNPWTTGDELGTLGLLAIFFLGVGALAYLLIELSERFAAPQALAALRIERIPWFGFFLVWLVLAAVIDSSGTYYDVRVLQTSTALPKESPAQAYDTWETKNAKGTAVPLLFVSTSGGGIRAAYWTAIVLECVVEGRGAEACADGGDNASARAGRAFFAASGISGGSLGLVNYEAHLANPRPGEGWPERRLGGDYLAPTVGWALFVDLPFALLRRDGGTDRAEVLERGWERSWIDNSGETSTLATGLFESWRRRPFPLLLLNGTKVQDGCRFETSVLDESIKLAQKQENNETLVEDCMSLRLFERSSNRYVTPADRKNWTLASTEDLVDYLCRTQDVRLSTAALMSARFPYVLSSGRVSKCDGSTAVNLVDGGYFDTSAASPIVELWDRLRPQVDAENRAAGTCVVPVFLQIDNSYASEAAPGRRSRPWESSAPLQALGGSRNAREANARQAAALAFGAASFGNVLEAVGPNGPIDRVAHIYPRAHPGSKAPLGWTLSDASMEDLRLQLETEANKVEIEKVREWFSAGLTCHRGTAR